ncbi:hypothetical protein E2C01_050885 [Portunus trituberculatus]|uniref:Uncharacterized protein n=1 Tax=Portunus trituberculatus TaxID=210409 RepID=A0A5B7GIQ6_PORTR|nr:hypothetical protein [Portunus trituberculatus]
MAIGCLKAGRAVAHLAVTKHATVQSSCSQRFVPPIGFKIFRGLETDRLISPKRRASSKF